MPPSTSENERREQIRTLVGGVRAEATALRGRIRDARTKTFLVPIFYTLDDVDTLWLGGSDSHEPWWYDWAERYARVAEKELREIIAALDSRGGPDNAVFR